MRFIGNKELITSEVKDLLKELDLASRGLTLFDAFCGSGAISDSLKDSFNIVSNDMLKWCVIYTRGRVCANNCTFNNLGFDPFSYLNNNKDIVKGFFYKNYSPIFSERKYFTPENAGRIDYFRITIESWKNKNLIDENEYSFLLASLIESVSCVSNTAGVYGAFLKHWDPRAIKSIEFKKVNFNSSLSLDSNFLCEKIEDVIYKIDCDVLYLDPPYTQNQYGTQYHLLETLVLYDDPEISKVTGSRSTKTMRSDWSKEYKCHILLDKLLAKTNARYVLFSYSKDGFMSKSFIEASMKRYGKSDTYICKKIDYKKYTNFKSRKKSDHFEYLFFIERKDQKDVVYESPLNYIGSKAKMASFIRSKLPNNIDTFVDLFGGGLNVGINIDVDRVIYNDINYFVTNLVSSFRSIDTYQYILFLKRIVNKFGLEPKNAESYKKIRDYYNLLPPDKRDSRVLFAVLLYGYNQQVRFNGDHEFNNPVGMRWFNDKVLEKMISFSRVVKEKNISFESTDYSNIPFVLNGNLFIYLDPPYMLTNGSYNDGKRGFHGWNECEEKKFFDFVDRLNRDGVLFMVSYVSRHKEIHNYNLDNWIECRGYHTTEVDSSLVNNRREIIITNYVEDTDE